VILAAADIWIARNSGERSVICSDLLLLQSQNKQLFNEIDKDNSGQINHW